MSWVRVEPFSRIPLPRHDTNPNCCKGGVNSVFGWHGVFFFSSVFSLNLGENILVGLRRKHSGPTNFFPPLPLTKQPSKVFSLPNKKEFKTKLHFKFNSHNLMFSTKMLRVQIPSTSTIEL